ncbi:hypothetical protein GCM10009780_11990 [Actinomadura alba]
MGRHGGQEFRGTGNAADRLTGNVHPVSMHDSPWADKVHNRSLTCGIEEVGSRRCAEPGGAERARHRKTQIPAQVRLVVAERTDL